MNYFLINILYIVCVLAIISMACYTLRNLIYFYSKIKHALISSFHRDMSNEPSVEVSEDDVFRSRYDVAAFHERIQQLKIDDDGLYTPPSKDNYDEYEEFTGAEIISRDYENDLERKLGFEN